MYNPESYTCDYTVVRDNHVSQIPSKNHIDYWNDQKWKPYNGCFLCIIKNHLLKAPQTHKHKSPEYER